MIMKNWTAAEISADLARIDGEIKNGKMKFYTLAETKKHMRATVAKLKKRREQEQNEGKKTVGRRVASAL